MGQGNSRALFVQVLKSMLRSRGVKAGQRQLENFLSFVEEVCPWFPEEGTVDFETWKKVGIKLQDYYSAHEPKKVPADTFSLWNQIRDCLDPRHEGHRWSEGLMRGKSTSTSSLKETGELTPTAPEDQGELMPPPPPENPYQEAKEELLLAQEHHYDDLFNGLMPQNQEDLKITAAHYHDYWVQAIKQERPELVLNINGKNFKGILDTGADVSVISEQHWPPQWPKQSAITSLQGIGQAHSPEQSSELLSWTDEEGHCGNFQPYVLPNLPVNLWGRDVMQEMEAYIYSPSAAVTQQMFNQGLLPQQGLGPSGQGITEPLQPGLGYF